MTTLNITCTGLLFLKSDNIQRVENSRYLGKNELWSSENMHRHLALLNKAVPTQVSTIKILANWPTVSSPEQGRCPQMGQHIALPCIRDDITRKTHNFEPGEHNPQFCPRIQLYDLNYLWIHKLSGCDGGG
jgi:hypothetical protein